MKYNLQAIMVRAWLIFRRAKGVTFGEALHRSWLAEKSIPVNALRIEAAKAAAGVQEECNTWKGWADKGFEVRHGSKALFGAELIWGSKGDGATYQARFFGKSQVQAVA